jgi:hypothetical protein
MVILVLVILSVSGIAPPASPARDRSFLEPKMKTEMSRVTVKHFVDKPYMLDEVVETLQSLIDAPVASSGSNIPVT